MRESRFKEKQIVAILKEGEVCRHFDGSDSPTVRERHSKRGTTGLSQTVIKLDAA